MKNPALRGILVALTAAIVPAMLFMLPVWMADIGASYVLLIGIVDFSVAVAHIVILGIPAYFLARRLNLIRWWFSLFCGLLIGSIPTATILQMDYRYEVEHTHLTGEALIHFLATGAHSPPFPPDYFYMVAGTGIAGAAGGFAAWLVWRLTRPKTRR